MEGEHNSGITKRNATKFACESFKHRRCQFKGTWNHVVCVFVW